MSSYAQEVLKSSVIASYEFNYYGHDLSQYVMSVDNITHDYSAVLVGDARVTLADDGYIGTYMRDSSWRGRKGIIYLNVNGQRRQLFCGIGSEPEFDAGQIRLTLVDAKSELMAIKPGSTASPILIPAAADVSAAAASNPGNIIWQLLTKYAGYSADKSGNNPDIDYDSWAASTAVCDQVGLKLQIKLDGNSDIRSILKKIAEHIGGYIYHDRGNRLVFHKRLPGAAEDSVCHYTPLEHLLDLRQDTREELLKNVRVAYGVPAVGTSSLPGIVAKPVSLASGGDKIYQDSNCYHLDSTSANHLCDILVKRHGQPWDRLEFSTPLLGTLRELGDKIKITWPWLGLAAADYRIVNIREEPSRGRVTIQAEPCQLEITNYWKYVDPFNESPVTSKDWSARASAVGGAAGYAELTRDCTALYGNPDYRVMCRQTGANEPLSYVYFYNYNDLMMLPAMKQVGLSPVFGVAGCTAIDLKHIRIGTYCNNSRLDGGLLLFLIEYDANDKELASWDIRPHHIEVDESSAQFARYFYGDGYDNNNTTKLWGSWGTKQYHGPFTLQPNTHHVRISLEASPHSTPGLAWHAWIDQITITSDNLAKVDTDGILHLRNDAALSLKNLGGLGSNSLGTTMRLDLAPKDVSAGSGLRLSLCDGVKTASVVIADASPAQHAYVMKLQGANASFECDGAPYGSVSVTSGTTAGLSIDWSGPPTNLRGQEVLIDKLAMVPGMVAGEAPAISVLPEYGYTPPVTGLALELVNVLHEVPDIRVKFTPPAGYEMRYRLYRRVSGSEWQMLGWIEPDQTIAGEPGLNQVKVVGVHSPTGQVADFGQASTASVSISLAVPDMPAVTVDFSGRDCSLTWPHINPLDFDSYQVDIYSGSDHATLLRSIVTTAGQAVYSYANNLADGGPRPDLYIRVTMRTRHGQSSYVDVEAHNAAPTAASLSPVVVFATRDCEIRWSGSAAADLDYYDLKIFSDADRATLLRSLPLKQSSYTYTYEHNLADAGPRSQLYFRLAAVDAFGLIGSVDFEAANAAPAAPSAPTLIAITKGLQIRWPLVGGDVERYEVFVGKAADSTASAGVVYGDNLVVTGLDPKTCYYVRIRANDAFQPSAYSASVSATTLADDMALSFKDYDIDMPLTDGLAWTQDASTASWPAFAINLSGTVYSIAAGSTQRAYIWFDPAASVTDLQTSDNLPTLSGSQWLLAIFDKVSGRVYPASSYRILHGGMIQARTLTGDALIVDRAVITTSAQMATAIIKDVHVQGKLSTAVTEADKTQTVIDQGLITTGTVQLKDTTGIVQAGVTAAGSGDSAVRFWAGADIDHKAAAPFRVTQNGNLFLGDDRTYLKWDSKALDTQMKNLRLYAEPNPAAPQVLSVSSGGSMQDGSYKYKIIFELDDGTFTAMSALTNEIAVSAGNAGKVTLQIPTGSPFVVRRHLFRSLGKKTAMFGVLYFNEKNLGQSSSDYGKIAEITDSSVTQYVDTALSIPSAWAGAGDYRLNQLSNTGGLVYIGSSLVGYIQGRCTILGVGAARGITPSSATDDQTVCIGPESGNKGLGCVFVGARAGYNNTGGCNVAIGLNAMRLLASGNTNIAIGQEAMVSSTSGDSNVAIGNLSGGFATSGSNNVAIGASAGPGGNYSNTVSIGQGAQASANNYVRIGNASITQIGGQVGWSTLSDGRFKSDVDDSKLGLDFILALRPRVFRLIESPDELHIGLISQEVKAVIDDLSSAGEPVIFSGWRPAANEHDRESLIYADFVMPLINSVKELKALVDAQAGLIAAQADQLAALSARLEHLEKGGA